MKLTNEFESIRAWANARGIYEKGDVKTQFVKLLEEVGELSKAILNQDADETKDAIGDIVVVLTNLTELCNKDLFATKTHEDLHLVKKRLITTEHGSVKIEDCINSAFKVIESRTGIMHNGTFKKHK